MELLKEINNWNIQLENKSAEEIISFFADHFKDKIAFASSLGLEDQVITHMICNSNLTTKIFTLDTGRIFPETYSLISRTNERYDTTIQVYFPNSENVERMVNTKGVNLFYESIENRKECCNVRKIEPLKRAFAGLDAWICGLRKSQSVTRSDMNLVEWDSNNNLIKINPLINWTEEQIWEYIRKNNIPYNTLHDKGFPSIGCQPCTRAIKPGDDIRAGRWWWENPDQKECGLHAKH
jgi:phosphoadenosine phosphosulfate reductase